jgi:non-specific serine/threonine protein kinase
VIDICRRLDGIALAIELAAARTNRFSLETIAGQLQEHFLLATGGSRAPLPRHKTMQALFDWSYDLLSEREQSVFRRLSVFAGGFTLDLATAVCANGDIGNDEVVNAIASLVDKSLVQAEAYAEPARYRLLEPPRQYAHEKLREQGEDSGTLRTHALALLALAESFDSSPVMTPDRVWDTVVVPERENFRVAIGWALGANGDAQIAQRLAGSRCATRSGFASGEARRWVRAALETCDETTPPKVRGRLEVASIRVALVLDGSAPEAALTEAQRALLSQQPDDLPEVAEAHYLVALGLFHSGRIAESETALRQALATACRSNVPNITAAATAMLGMTRWAHGDLEEARSLVREALRIHRIAGSERFAATDAGGLAEIEFAAGQSQEALRLSQESIEVFRTRRNWSYLAWALCNSSVYLIALGRYDEARNDAREALVLARKVGVRRPVAWALQHLAALSAVNSIHEADHRQNLARSAHLIGFIDDRFCQIASTRQRTEQKEYEEVLVILREAFGEEEAARLMHEGKTWSEDRAVAQALEI